MYVSVQNGTGAGRKRPKREKPRAWWHVCKDGLDVVLPGYMPRCFACKTTRP